MTDFRVWLLVGGIFAAMFVLIYAGTYAAGRLMMWADRRDAEAAKRAEDEADIYPAHVPERHHWSRR